MYDRQEPGEKLWQVNEKALGYRSMVYQSRFVYARGRADAKKQFAEKYKRYQSSKLTAFPMGEEEQ